MTIGDVHPVNELPRLLLTPEEAAHTLGIGRTKLYELLRTRLLASVMIGGSRRIPAAAVTKLVADLEEISYPEAQPTRTNQPL
jgi:excisionase family DNA binding protein